MSRFMKLIYSCLTIVSLFLLNACGSPEQASAPPAAPVTRTSEVPGAGESKGSDRKAAGELSLIGSDRNAQTLVLTLQDKSRQGAIYCEKTSTNAVAIALGTFHQADGKLFKSVPLTGLSLTIPSQESASNLILEGAVFNVDSSFPSSPFCSYTSEGLKDTVLKGTLRCYDNAERNGWGQISLTASFSCSL